jgi:hypothetical protein
MAHGSIRLFMGWLVGLAVLLLIAAPAYASAVSTGNADAITSSGARLNGLLDPSVGGFTWFFQYGTSSDLSSAATSTAPQTASISVGDLDAVSQLVSGLKPGYTYYYRVVLETPAGTGVTAAELFGDTDQFTTVAQALLVKRSSRIFHSTVSFPLRCLGEAGRHAPPSCG